jgi:hypothetical protein
MTPDTYHKYPDLRQCTYLRRNQWKKTELRGGDPTENEVMDIVGRTFTSSRILLFHRHGRHLLDAHVPGWLRRKYRDYEYIGRYIVALKPEIGRVAKRALLDDPTLFEKRYIPKHLHALANEMSAIMFDNTYDSAAPILPNNVRDSAQWSDESSDEEEDEEDGGEDSPAIGFYIVEGTACVASIELLLADTDNLVGKIYARTHKDRQKLDLYSLAIAATVIYTTHFPFVFSNGHARPSKLDQLYSQAVVVPSMWVLRPYRWVFPTERQFAKKQNDTYEAYQQYYDYMGGKGVNITLDLDQHNVEAAGKVLRDLCAKKKFCHTLPRLKSRERMAGGKHSSKGVHVRNSRPRRSRIRRHLNPLHSPRRRGSRSSSRRGSRSSSSRRFAGSTSAGRHAKKSDGRRRRVVKYARQNRVVFRRQSS